MICIDGKKIAEKILEKLKQYPRPERFLSAFLIGNNLASVSFLRQKEAVAKELGISFQLHSFPENITTKELLKELGDITSNVDCGGIIIQLPLPRHIDREAVLHTIPNGKDVDVINPTLFFSYQCKKEKIFSPAIGVVAKIVGSQYTLLADLLTKRVAVVGMGALIGKPIAHFLREKTKELCTFDIGDSFETLSDSDLVILGTGQSGIVKPALLKEGSGVIDFGYGKKGEKLSGDLDISDEKALKRLAFYTPTPGGTGPVLVAQLFENFYKLNGKLPS